MRDGYNRLNQIIYYKLNNNMQTTLKPSELINETILKLQIMGGKDAMILSGDLWPMMKQAALIEVKQAMKPDLIQPYRPGSFAWDMDHRVHPMCGNQPMGSIHEPLPKIKPNISTDDMAKQMADTLEAIKTQVALAGGLKAFCDSLEKSGVFAGDPAFIEFKKGLSQEKKPQPKETILIKITHGSSENRWYNHFKGKTIPVFKIDELGRAYSFTCAGSNHGEYGHVPNGHYELVTHNLKRLTVEIADLHAENHNSFYKVGETYMVLPFSDCFIVCDLNNKYFFKKIEKRHTSIISAEYNPDIRKGILNTDELKKAAGWNKSFTDTPFKVDFNPDKSSKWTEKFGGGLFDNSASPEAVIANIKNMQHGR